MVGTVTYAIVEALRTAGFVDAENVSVVAANDDGQGVVNTALPALAVNIQRTEEDGQQYIGGMIQNDYLLQVSCIINFDNAAFSPDDDTQKENLNLGYRVMRYLAACDRGYYRDSLGNAVNITLFDELKQNYDFHLQYRGLETYQTRAFSRDVGEQEVMVERVMFRVTFVTKDMDDTFGDTLEAVHMKCGCKNTTIYGTQTDTEQ